MIKEGILFFADKLPPKIGGMEVHAEYFIRHFTNHPSFPISAIISKNESGQDYLILNNCTKTLKLKTLKHSFKPSFIFFNSGRWIEDMALIREMFSDAMLIYRTGGNEIIKAPLIQQKETSHLSRQRYWVKTLNSTVDLLITNSVYTEKRLREIEIICPFLRCVGGVNISALEKTPKNSHPYITIFSAARFVPYKNHTLLISLIYELILRGHHLKLRLAGDGPLLKEIKGQVQQYNLTSAIEFLGVLDNEKTCKEIARANIYIQLSTDRATEVIGGSYIHSEGMGRSILEALSVGTFVIAGKSGALPEVITSERGCLIDTTNFDYLVNQVGLILNKKPETLPMIKLYNWETLFKSYEKIFTNRYENIACH